MNFKRFHESKNLFDISSSEIGLISSNGDVGISDSYSTSNYIAITEPFSLSLTSVFTSLRLVRVGYYDVNKINIRVEDSSTFKNGYKVFTFTPPNRTRYIRFSYISRKDIPDTNIMLNLGLEALPYEPYGNTWIDLTLHIMSTTWQNGSTYSRSGGSWSSSLTKKRSRKKK